MSSKKTDNSRYISLDVSTTNVGMAVWDGKGRLLELKHLELKIDRKIEADDRYIYKANLLRDYLYKYQQLIYENGGKVLDVFIEAPLSNTPRNINTTAMLLGFNGIACYKIYEIFNIIPKKITVYESRRIFCPEFITKKGTLSFPKGWKNKEKKEYIRSRVEKLEPQIEWFYTRNNTIKDTSYDMSDAYAVGFAGLVVLGIIKHDTWKLNV